ncbi:hypothetical protein AURDEDRAFT_109252 [Auricularia subglabra TFB-10046 SS5]|uniref:U4/U6 snRNA-associated-splicing factor PRP24 n=1 Tax=Auricularia subglabra (strain TFB-10046 / SS5) TaxID=717982 RepID=J0D6Z8_AURST|nr:hypothetical protein AURDEDRAFT_109252 [Auricularia subglabra TFB-10046 SS5]
MVMVMAAPPDVWLPLLEFKEKELGDTLEGVKEVHELYQRAEQDYLSTSVLLKHMSFIIDRQDLFALGAGGDDDDDTDEAAVTRDALAAIVDRGAWHLTEGHEVWNKYCEWEMQQLETLDASEREAQLDRIDKMFLARLQTPHSAFEETSQAYSSFNSTHRPAEDYEKIMVAVTKTRSSAVKAWNTRETSEIALRNASNSLEAYGTYLSEEKHRLQQASKPEPARKGRKPPPPKNAQDAQIALSLLRTLHERAITAAAQRVWAGEDGAAAKLRAFWLSYAGFLRTAKTPEPRKELATLYRATRSVPASGDAWAAYLRALERHADVEGPKESVEEAFGRALGMGVVQDSVEDIVPLVQARADFERRSASSAQDEENGEEGGPVERLVQTLEGGIELVRNAGPAGDPRLRLEKHLGAIYEDMDETERALEMWEATAKFFKTSYLAWDAYLRLLTKSDPPKARTVFRDVSAKNLDWPEMLWEAWLGFEHIHGSVEDVDDCVARVTVLNEKLTAKRAKEAEAYQTAYAQQAAAAAPVAEAQDAMQVDEPPQDGGAVSKKRKAEDDDTSTRDEGEANKRVKIDDSVLKRDRENSTVLVADLSADASEAALKKFFKDCGAIREIKLTQLASGPVASVEFMSRESVPAALTRDKKRIDGQEVAVHVGWKSTLYVTNFPERTDDTAMRDLFGQFGVLLDVRWPSKKFKSTRRFCYVQFTSPAAAEASLSLHGRELEPGMKLSVLMSDPTRKKERTDADANERELYIAGLSRFTKREELQALFQQFGTIKDIRISLDDNGHCKGFAFVEFAEPRSAHSGLSANNFELKSRRIAVTLADPRVKAKHKHDATGLGRKSNLRSRSVRVRGLPSGTQEGLLQQAFEKEFEGVKRVELFVSTNEAVVEFDSQAAVGKVMLKTTTTPFVFQGQELALVEESVAPAAPQKANAVPSAANASSSATSFIPRGVASRPRAGIGSRKRGGAAAVSAGAGIVSKASTNPTASLGAAATSEQGGKGQDDFRKMLGL